jgi:hypothetical protein
MHCIVNCVLLLLIYFLMAKHYRYFQSVYRFGFNMKVMKASKSRSQEGRQFIDQDLIFNVTGSLERNQIRMLFQLNRLVFICFDFRIQS